jgi:hypothetical protein
VAETFLICTRHGPRPGTRVAEGWAWPLPDLLLADGGTYVKVTESELPPLGEDSGVLRGAGYRWQEGDATAEQLTGAIATAIKTRRFEEVSALLHLLALQDPHQAQAILDTVDTLREEAPGA